jgi:hypothetical protein
MEPTEHYGWSPRMASDFPARAAPNRRPGRRRGDRRSTPSCSIMEAMSRSLVTLLALCAGSVVRSCGARAGYGPTPVPIGYLASTTIFASPHTATTAPFTYCLAAKTPTRCSSAETASTASSASLRRSLPHPASLIRHRRASIARAGSSALPRMAVRGSNRIAATTAAAIWCRDAGCRQSPARIACRHRPTVCSVSCSTEVSPATSMPTRRSNCSPRPWSGAAGIATRLRRPQAVILYGISAENGKSAILELCRAPLPKTAAVAISPDKFNNDYYAVGLVGAMLNATDELSTARAITSDRFKTAITGGMMPGRSPYGDVVYFQPKAQHVLAANALPNFAGGIDRGVERRLLLLVFNRVLPAVEQIPALVRRIAEEEADLLLAFVVAGASRLRANGAFTVPLSSTVELRQWLNTADPVRAWVSSQVTVMTLNPDEHRVTTRRAHEQFVEWAKAEGFRGDMLPASNGFTQRVRAHAPGVGTGHKETGNCLIGIRIGPRGGGNEI